jgi:hypothetical protein
MPAPYTLPPDTRSVGSGNPPADMNAATDALNALATAIANALGVPASGFAGGGMSGAPVSGTYTTNQFAVNQDGSVWLCTAGGTQGTWVQVTGVPAPTAAGQYPVSNSSSQWTLTQGGTVGGNTYNTGWTVGLSDLGGEALYNSASPGTATIPSGLTATVGASLAFRQLGAGALTVAAGGGVTVEGVLVTTSQYQVLFARQVSVNVWAVTGSVAIGTTAALPAGVAAAGTTGFPSDGGHVHGRPGVFLPQDFGLKAWAYEPVIALSVSTALNARIFYAMAVVGQTTTLANVCYICTIAGTSGTSGQCWAGIYSLTGTTPSSTMTQIATSADISGSIGSTGVVSVAMTSPTGTLAAGTIIVIALLWNSTGTYPTLARVAANFLNTGGTYGDLGVRFTQSSSTATTLPAGPTTLSTLGAPGVAYWLGAS